MTEICISIPVKGCEGIGCVLTNLIYTNEMYGDSGQASMDADTKVFREENMGHGLRFWEFA